MTDTTNKVVVTLKIGVDVDAFINEMSNVGSTTPHVPHRAVEIHNLKPSSLRNVDFIMTRDEMEELQNDPRVLACRWGTKAENGFVIKPAALPTSNVTYTRSSTYLANGNADINWGLFDSSYTSNPFTFNQMSNRPTPYTLDGTGVDIVIQDSGLQIDHPEFQNANGVSRVQMINWLGGASNVTSVSWAGSGNRTVTFNHSAISTAIPIGANVTIYNFYTPNSINSANLTNVRLLNIGSVQVTDSTTTKTIVSYPNDLDFTNIYPSSVVPGIIGYFPNGAVTGLPNFYTDNSGHGTNVGSIAAGKTYGWAPNANIYVMNVTGVYQNGSPDPSARISGANIGDAGFNLIGAWHLSKPVDPITGWRRPTIVNMSWTVGTQPLAYRTQDNVVHNPATDGNIYTANVINYHSANTSLPSGPVFVGNVALYQNYGLFPQFNTLSTNLTAGILSTVPGYVDSIDADAADCIQNGVILVGSAGNESYKIDIPTGSDYNNYITVDVANSSTPNTVIQTNKYYYNRGGSPTALNVSQSMYLPNGTANLYHVINAGTVCVGAIDYTLGGTGNYSGSINYQASNATAKAWFSSAGPRVDVYAAGGMVAGATCTTKPLTAGNNSSYANLQYPVTPYYANSAYKQQKYSGTSQSAPQVTGVLATVLQANPYFTQLDAQNWIIQSSANSKIANIGGQTTTPYTEPYNLQGANSRYLFNPYQANAPLTITGSGTLTGGTLAS